MLLIKQISLVYFLGLLLWKNRRLKVKSEILLKIGEILGKWLTENCKLAYFTLQR